jgi:polysaccharide export outer membrane protein
MQAKTLAILIVMASAATVAGAQDTTSPDNNKKAATLASAATTKIVAPVPAAGAEDPDYEIGAGDTLNISVWKEPELSGSIPVRPDGKVSLPLLNDVQAAGTTPTKLAATITDRLRQYVNDPQVTVIVTAANSRRIYLIGELVRPGAIPMSPKMTLLQALSSSGGFSQFANVKRMYVLRAENGKQTKIPVNYKAAIGGRAPDQNITLKPGDTIVVP